jgi:hypothetical protein
VIPSAADHSVEHHHQLTCTRNLTNFSRVRDLQPNDTAEQLDAVVQVYALRKGDEV